MTAMEQTSLSHYDGPVPRYTSYPTAAQFDATVGSDQHCAWLRDLNGIFAALYLYVPFWGNSAGIAPATRWRCAAKVRSTSMSTHSIVSWICLPG
jgi:hypothetical protein